jgi:hypothetical protein
MHDITTLVAWCAASHLSQIKNPWARKRWLGPYSFDDKEHWTPQLKAALSYDTDSARHDDNGVFWIDWESVKK